MSKINDERIRDTAVKIVEYNVIHNCSYLVSELVKDEKYSEELYEVCMQHTENEDGEEEENEALEHWIVNDYLGGLLRDRGEMVIDFMDFCIWGRTCSEQAIYLDSVFMSMAKDMLEDK